MIKLNRIKALKKKFNTTSVEQGFVCDGEERAIINVGAENYDDIFSPYCYKGGDTLSPTLVDYLQQKSNTIPLDYDLTIRFHVKNANEQKRKEIQAAVKENYRSDTLGIERKMHRTTMFSLWFVLFGIIFTIIYLFTVDFIPIAVSYIIDIMAWIFLWEGVDAFFLDRRHMQIDRIKALRLGTAKIEIIEFEPY